MFRPKLTSPDEDAKAFLLAMWRSEASPTETPHLTGPLGFDDFLFRILASQEDPASQHVFVEWMVGRLLGLSRERACRVPLDSVEFRFSRSYAVRIVPLAGSPIEEHFAFCCRRKHLDKTGILWQAWCPDNWTYFLFTQREFDAAGDISFKTFLERQVPMKAAEFRFVARARLGLEP